ncbi:Abi family protein [Streptococcus uberis]|uniref:Abi family protein n=1 Tax=Streptococcus uberis TaxID=1349 RepID=UPI001939F259|nr:Abi family protein [Streptococcus uberis]
MSDKRYHGQIEKVFNNYGILSSEIDGIKVSFFFFITPNLLYKGKDFRITKEVTFSLVNSQIRGVKVKIATNLKQCPDKKYKKYKISKNDIYAVDDYHQYIFKKFYGVENEEILSTLIELDTEFKEIVLKWTLRIERVIKNQILNLFSENEINSQNMYEKLEQDKTLKNLKDKTFKSLKSRYIFRSEFELFKIEEDKNGNLASFDLIDVPLALFLENLTIDELGKVYQYIMMAYKDQMTKESQTFKFLNYNKQMFSELSIIRNSCAHGNSFIPLILDDSYSPSFLFDLESVWPNHNSGNNVEEEWELFEAIRFSTRMLYKSGIVLFNAGSPLLSALYLSKYILINPARRSFFSFMFIVLSYFKFIDNTDEKKFYKEMQKYILVPLEDEEDLEENSLKIYPQNNPVMKQIISFIYILFSDDFWVGLQVTQDYDLIKHKHV